MAWEIDYAHAHIQFQARHMMVAWVRGEFEKFTGEVHFDEENPENSSVYVEIDAASIDTRLKDRDNHLRSPDFLDVEKYPKLIFRSKRVELVDDKHAKLVGDLTIRDVTREVTLDVTYAGQYKAPFGPFISAGFSATTKINRKDWGLTWNVGLEAGGWLVGEEVMINIDLELRKPLEEAQAEKAEAVA